MARTALGVRASRPANILSTLRITTMTMTRTMTKNDHVFAITLDSRLRDATRSENTVLRHRARIGRSELGYTTRWGRLVTDSLRASRRRRHLCALASPQRVSSTPFVGPTTAGSPPRPGPLLLLVQLQPPWIIPTHHHRTGSVSPIHDHAPGARDNLEGGWPMSFELDTLTIAPNSRMPVTISHLPNCSIYSSTRFWIDSPIILYSKGYKSIQWTVTESRGAFFSK